MAKKSGGNADDILLNINVTGREQLKGARDDAKGLRKETQDGANVDLAKPFKSLRVQLREATVEAQRLAAQGKEGTKEFTNAAKKVADLRDRQEDLNRTFKAFDPDNKFKVFATTARAGASIVQGYAGAMAFLNVNSQDALETIAKLQGIMAFVDAIGSLSDLKDSFKDLRQVLGFTTTSAQAAADAQAELGIVTEVAAAEAVSSANTQVTANTEIATSAEASALAQKASQDAVNAARLTGVTSLEELIAIGNIAYEQTMLQAQANTALAESEIIAGGAAVEQGVAMAGTAVAEEAATVGAIGLGTALKAIGIGLIISAIAYLITNFQTVKKAVQDLFPGLKTAGNLFNSVKEIAFGVGNVILQFIIAPIKVLIDLLKGDFKGALADLKAGANVVANFNKGVAYEAANIAEEQKKKRIASEIEANTRIIAERKALGEETYKLEQKNIDLKIKLLDKDKLSEEDYEKQRLDLVSEGTVARNAELKKRSDKYKELLKTDLDAIKANEKENFKIVQQGLGNQRSIELTDLNTKYAAELELLNKRKSANKNYSRDYNDLVAARKIEEARVNKKYDDAIQAYSDEVAESYFTKYEKREADIRKKADDLLKNATPAQAGQIKQNESFLLNQNSAESIASSASNAANTALTYAENDNRPSPRDTPQEAVAKINNLESAKLDAERAAYELKKVELEGQYEELKQLDADHEKSKTDIERDAAESRKQIAAAELETRLKLFDALGAGASAASDILGDSTIAGKGLAVAAATISTYSAIAGQLAAFSGIPIPGYAIAQAIATGLVGLAQVKKILSVQVPAKSGASGGAGGQAAPVINSTVLQQANAGTNQVVNAVNQKNNAPAKPLKAYIVNKDLKDQQTQNSYYEAQSTY